MPIKYDDLPGPIKKKFASFLNPEALQNFSRVNQESKQIASEIFEKRARDDKELHLFHGSGLTKAESEVRVAKVMWTYSGGALRLWSEVSEIEQKALMENSGKVEGTPDFVINGVIADTCTASYGKLPGHIVPNPQMIQRKDESAMNAVVKNLQHKLNKYGDGVSFIAICDISDWPANLAENAGHHALKNLKIREGSHAYLVYGNTVTLIR